MCLVVFIYCILPAFLFRVQVSTFFANSAIIVQHINVIFVFHVYYGCCTFIRAENTINSHVYCSSLFIIKAFNNDPLIHCTVLLSVEVVYLAFSLQYHYRLFTAFCISALKTTIICFLCTHFFRLYKVLYLYLLQITNARICILFFLVTISLQENGLQRGFLVFKITSQF